MRSGAFLLQCIKLIVKVISLDRLWEKNIVFRIQHFTVLQKYTCPEHRWSDGLPFSANRNVSFFALWT